jgi:hypothetical protein
MPLYLDEIYINESGLEQTKRSINFLAEAIRSGLPPGVTLKAGPWMSNEEPKVVLVLDIKDHSQTFNPFSKAMAQGIIVKRRLQPIVEWSDAIKMAGEL